MAYSKGQWTEVTTDDGDVWVLAGDVLLNGANCYE